MGEIAGATTGLEVGLYVGNSCPEGIELGIALYHHEGVQVPLYQCFMVGGSGNDHWLYDEYASKN